LFKNRGNVAETIITLSAPKKILKTFFNTHKNAMNKVSIITSTGM